MTFTYGNPGDSQKDAIRFLIQDTDPTEMFLQDEEIEWMITLWGSRGGIHYVAARCCEAIAAIFARETHVSSDSQSVSLGELTDKYMRMAESLMATENAMSVGELFVGGGSGSGTHGPIFAVGMHDDWSNGPQDSFFKQWPDPEQWGRSIP